jgi:hypothetical protein
MQIYIDDDFRNPLKTIKKLIKSCDHIRTKKYVEENETDFPMSEEVLRQSISLVEKTIKRDPEYIVFYSRFKTLISVFLTTLGLMENAPTSLQKIIPKMKLKHLCALYNYLDRHIFMPRKSMVKKDKYIPVFQHPITRFMPMPMLCKSYEERKLMALDATNILYKGDIGKVNFKVLTLIDSGLIKKNDKIKYPVTFPSIVATARGKIASEAIFTNTLDGKHELSIYAHILSELLAQNYISNVSFVYGLWEFPSGTAKKLFAKHNLDLKNKKKKSKKSKKMKEYICILENANSVSFYDMLKHVIYDDHENHELSMYAKKWITQIIFQCVFVLSVFNAVGLTHNCFNLKNIKLCLEENPSISEYQFYSFVENVEPKEHEKSEEKKEDTSASLKNFTLTSGQEARIENFKISVFEPQPTTKQLIPHWSAGSIKNEKLSTIKYKKKYGDLNQGSLTRDLYTFLWCLYNRFIIHPKYKEHPKTLSYKNFIKNDIIARLCPSLFPILFEELFESVDNFALLLDGDENNSWGNFICKGLAEPTPEKHNFPVPEKCLAILADFYETLPKD